MELIDKSVVLKEIERRAKFFLEQSKNRPGSDDISCSTALYGLLSFFENLEVKKDIDFNEEYIEEIQSHINGIRDKVDRMTSGNFMHSKAAIRFSTNTIENVLKLMGIINKGK